MLYRMLSVERAWEMSARGLRKPRQIFLTKSPLLAQKVGENYQKLAASFATASWTREEIRHQATMPDEDQALRMVHSDDITNFRSDLPTKFSAVRDEGFPLFLTFDKVYDAPNEGLCTCTDVQLLSSCRCSKLMFDHECLKLPTVLCLSLEWPGRQKLPHTLTSCVTAGHTAQQVSRQDSVS
jgi:hypothetical protein